MTIFISFFVSLIASLVASFLVVSMVYPTYIYNQLLTQVAYYFDNISDEDLDVLIFKLETYYKRILFKKLQMKFSKLYILEIEHKVLIEKLKKISFNINYKESSEFKKILNKICNRSNI
jgi:hypothetical protein